ncbi:DUF6301 family protein [Nocardia tengchongensis]|uniref:DUF6301 family protein n=1 Tax=Nocardia tengchongensis TaxID=2055889 RepID=UPI00369FCD17
MMRIPVRVDVVGALEIVRAAAVFEWTWGLDDRERFAATVGWSDLETVEGDGEAALCARTSLAVWNASALFLDSGDELCQVHVIVSDSPDKWAAGTPGLLADAAGQVVAGLTRMLGEPAIGAAGTEFGPVWESAGVTIGLGTARNAVELLLISPVWQRVWEARQQERTTRRARLTEWDRFAESLAGYTDSFYSDAAVNIQAPDGQRIRMVREDDGWQAGFWRPGDEGSAYRSYLTPAPLHAIDHSRLATWVVTELAAAGVRSPIELRSRGWDSDGTELDTSALRPADDRPAVLHAESPREIPVPPEDLDSVEDVELDVPGALEVVAAAATFDWTWTRADVERFAAHAGWSDVFAPDGYPMIYATSTLNDGNYERNVIFWSEGDKLTSIQVYVSTDLCDYDLEDDSYSHLKDQLDLAAQLTLAGFRESLGDPVHGKLKYSSALCWEFPDFTVGPLRNDTVIVLELTAPSQRDLNRTITLAAAAGSLTAATWHQLTEDLAHLLAVALPAEATLTIGGDDNWFARFTRQPGTLHAELGSPEFLDPEWQLDLTAHLTYQGWTPPDAIRNNWRRELSLPVMPRDYLHLAGTTIAALRRRNPCSPTDLRLRLEGLATLNASAWPWS